MGDGIGKYLDFARMAGPGVGPHARGACLAPGDSVALSFGLETQACNAAIPSFLKSQSQLHCIMDE